MSATSCFRPELSRATGEVGPAGLDPAVHNGSRVTAGWGDRFPHRSHDRTTCSLGAFRKLPWSGSPSELFQKRKNRRGLEPGRLGLSQSKWTHAAPTTLNIETPLTILPAILLTALHANTALDANTIQTRLMKRRCWERCCWERRSKRMTLRFNTG